MNSDGRTRPLPTGFDPEQGLALRDVAWRGRPALHGVSVAGAPGRVLVLLGPPGGGGGSLLRLIAGAARPQRGTLTLAGRPLARGEARLAEREDALAPGRTLLANVARALPGPAARRRALAETSLELASVPLTPRPARDATPGERRRALWARAASASPAVLLLEEPLAGLGPSARIESLWALRRLHAALGAITVIATADGAAAMALADHLVVLEAGRVVQAGPPREIHDRPESLAAASLTGEANLLPGHVVALEDDLARLRLACGPVVSAAPAPTLRVRDPCLLCLRPSRIALAAADLGEDALPATILDAMPEGASLRLRLLIGDGALLEATRPLAAGLRGYSPGTRLSLAWQPHQAQALPVALSRNGPL